MNAFQLPDDTRVSQVHLRTGNLDRAVAFYRDVLGLKVVGDKNGIVALSASGQLPALVVLTEDRKAKPRPQRATGLFHLAIRYPSRRELAHASHRLARHQHPIQGASDHIVSEAIYLADADGNGVELYVDRPKAQWIWRNGQVTMATEPLDIDSLLAAGEGRDDPPSPQTDLGHIHLHVADLAAAEKFFHGFIGLAVTQRSYPGALFMSAGGYHHHVAVNTWAGRTPAAPDSVGLISYRLEVPEKENLRQLRDRALEVGFETKTATSENGTELLQIRDPNGNWLEVEGR